MPGARGVGPLGMDEAEGLNWASLPGDHGQVLLCDPGQCFSCCLPPLIMEEGSPPQRGRGAQRELNPFL